MQKTPTGGSLKVVCRSGLDAVGTSPSTLGLPDRFPLASFTRTVPLIVQWMTRYKHYDCNQPKMIPLRVADQVQPVMFDSTLNHMVDDNVDMNLFESCYRNDHNDDPAILLKIVLFAYSRSITTGTKIS